MNGDDVDVMRPLAARLAEEEGLSTAELLANAALAIGALVAIWGGLEALGIEVVDSIRAQLAP